MFGTNNGIAGHVLLEGGTQAQKKQYLPKLATGEWTASFALTEEDAGSDPAGLVTSVAADGADGWVINGLKRFITNAPGRGRVHGVRPALPTARPAARSRC